MDISATIKELSDRLGPPRERAPFGQWTSYAWIVRGLVEKHHGVTDAVRHVLENSGFVNSKSAFGSLRAAFYKIRDAEWPAEISNKELKKIEPKYDEFE